MDLKAHYQKIRELERSFAGACPVIVSVETPDGGKAGVMTEVPAGVAAKMIVEGRARAANEQETTAFHNQNTEAKRAADQRDPAKRLNVTAPTQAGRR